MKKLCVALVLSLSVVSCTTRQEDIEYLQSQFEVVEPLSEDKYADYVCIDTTKDVYFVEMTIDGKIESKVKISK